MMKLCKIIRIITVAPLAAALVWALAVSALALGAAWQMRRVPGLRKIV